MASVYKAAEQGDADAQYRLGIAYYGGEGVIQDYDEACEMALPRLLRCTFRARCNLLSPRRSRS
jgi:hypothetical protein